MDDVTGQDVEQLASRAAGRADVLLEQLRADADDMARACSDLLDPPRQARGLRLLAEAIAAVEDVQATLTNSRQTPES
ncbi:MAG: hypothetical protein ACFCVE_06325 [Phycisphaerae bacterium]